MLESARDVTPAKSPPNNKIDLVNSDNTLVLSSHDVHMSMDDENEELPANDDDEKVSNAANNMVDGPH